MKISRGAMAALALGFVAGSRSMTAPAAVARKLARTSAIPERRRGRRLRSAMTSLALAEMVADKTPAVGSRLRAGPLAARIVSGAVSGAALAPWVDARRSTLAGVGALGALAGAYGFARVRRRVSERYRISDRTAGVMEDGLALGLAALALSSVKRRR